MKKRILSIAIIFTLLLSFTGCANSSNKTKETVNIASMKGPTAGLSKGELDIAAVPCNLASVLYNKTEGEILIAGINTLGVLYVVTKNCDINSVSDLKGKTIFSTGQGTTPEYSFNYIVSENGLDPEKDMTVQYYSEATEIAAAFASMDEVVTVLPEPFVTSVLNSNPDAKVALSLTDEWEDINYESAFVTGVIVVRKEFADNNPQVVNDFLAEYKVSVEYANKNVEGCAVLLEEFDIMKAAVAKKAIPNCNVVLITGKEMKEKVTSYLEVLYAANPQSVGGKLPDQAIFYNK